MIYYSIKFNCKLKNNYPDYFNHFKAPSYHSRYSPVNKIMIKIKEVSNQKVYLFVKNDEIIGIKIIISTSKIKKIILII